MQRLILAAVAVTLAGSPAFAASHRHHGRTPHHAARVQPWNGAYAAGRYGVSRPVYRNGYYLGADPDPNVRMELWRDPPNSRP